MASVLESTEYTFHSRRLGTSLMCPFGHWGSVLAAAHISVNKHLFWAIQVDCGEMTGFERTLLGWALYRYGDEYHPL